MEDILARYLDGDLTDEEATEFLRLTEQSLEIRNALHDHEAISEIAGQLLRVAPSEEFSDRTMAVIENIELRAPRSRSYSAGWPWLIAAAMLVVGVGLGFLSGRLPDPRTSDSADVRPPGVLVHGSFEAPDPGVVYLRAVQLVYSASDPEIRSVSVAGSFNGWDPVTVPMTREGVIWKVLLVLPPGTHEYMFVEDGDRWITDPFAPGVRHDGFGGANGVLNVSL